jgi:hypothetical protein
MAFAVLWARVWRRLGIITPRSPLGSDDRWFTRPEGGGGFAQCRERVLAAGVGDVGVSGRAGPDDGAIGELAVPPAFQSGPEGFQEMVSSGPLHTLA